MFVDKAFNKCVIRKANMLQGLNEKEIAIKGMQCCMKFIYLKSKIYSH